MFGLYLVKLYLQKFVFAFANIDNTALGYKFITIRSVYTIISPRGKEHAEI